ncbi:MAG: vancomycin resistance protein [Thermoflexia bacterium]|nr:MAG: vancomycin resistance protein [Thermoflexia bacterium]
MMVVAPQGDRLSVTLDREKLRAYLEALAPALAIEPVNARFHFDERTGNLIPIAPSAPGRTLDVDASIQNILAAVQAGHHSAPLVLRVVPPRYSESSTAAELGIRDLVAVGESYFIGSPSGRDHNIRLAASKFDGLVIGPGEVFSFNAYLGEVSAEAGYDEAYVTMGEQLAIEVGGGICQVSTTVFRAALKGGYPILERWAHYHRVGYYELRGHGPGLDATVYAPLVDFKFRNDRNAALLIETEIEETTHRLVFRFYSTDDGRRVVLQGPTVTDITEPGPPIYQLDPKLPPGTVVEWQTAQNGLTATVERWVYDAAGTLLYHDRFVSKYAPRRAAYHYGPGYEPPTQ